MQRIFLVVVMAAFCSASVADDGKVDPAKLYREKRAAEKALVDAEKVIAALRDEVGKLRAEIDAKDVAAETGKAIRDALITLAKIEPHIGKAMSDEELLAVVSPSPSSDPEAIKLQAKIRWCIKNHVLTPGMTLNEASQAMLIDGYKTGTNDDGTETWVWVMQQAREVTVRTTTRKEIDDHKLYEARVRGGKLLEVTKLREWFHGSNAR